MKALAPRVRLSLAALLVIVATHAIPLEPNSLLPHEIAHKAALFGDELKGFWLWTLVGITYLAVILLLCRFLGFNNIDDRQ